MKWIRFPALNLIDQKYFDAMREITGAKLAFLLSISEIIVAPELNQLIFLDSRGQSSQTLLLVDMKRYVQMLVFHGFQFPSWESFFPSIHFES
jgi:hypothetical protein